ncbi:MAG TPA: FMN-binding protein [Lacisediminihabitans sp.]|nr:FMN-binding protein [Lacisediminihabitans sp.]HXD60590.1 FMN-binding protein [Lacisediminihabitans sp.]
MRVRAVIGAVLASGAVILGGWEAGAQHAATHTVPATTPKSAGTAAPAPQPSGSSAAPTPTPAGPSVADGTYRGSLVATDYGTVRVSVTISGGRITDITPLKLTDDGGRSVQISRQAAPILRSEVLKAQSANVDSVSGATYTTEGYLTSLQAALDSAHFG